MLALLAAAQAGCQRSRYPRDGRVHLGFLAWGEGEEWQAFERIAAAYNRSQRRVTVHMEPVSYKFNEHLEARLAAGVGPDLFRVSYTNLGRFLPSGALIDLSPYLPPDLAAGFSPPLWTAITRNGKPHALPHQIDTSTLACNAKILQRLGVKPPQNLNEAWTWEQFLDISRSIQRHGLADFGFAMNWTFEGAFRWLNFLHQHGGQLLEADLRTPAITSRNALETLQWTRDWFTQRLTPASASTKTGEDVHHLWITGVVGMKFDIGVNDNKLYPADFPWVLTFLPRDRAAASELGGNAVGISRDCKHPEAAADFLVFLCNEHNMRDFCAASQYLPARTALMNGGMNYRFRPDALRIFVEQASTIPQPLIRTETLPGFDRINRKLAEELNFCFAGARAPEIVLQRLSLELHRALA